MDAALKTRDRPAGSRAQKPQQIGEAAARLFVEHGYGAVSMDAIAREAGVSKATIYAHYPDKAQLFAALMKIECEKQSPRLAVLDEGPLDIRETLTVFGRAYAEFLVSPRVVRVFRMVLAETPRFPELGRVFFENGPKMITDRLAAFLARAEAQGKLVLVGRRRFSAQQFLALLRCEFHLRTVLALEPPVDSREIAAVVAGAVEVFLRAYGG